MTLVQVCAGCLIAPLVGCAGWALLCVRARRPRPALRYPVGVDALHRLPDVAPRPVPPLDTPENPMRDTLIVARPLWWDTTERKEYE